MVIPIPTSIDPAPAPPPAQPPRSSFSCDRHPHEQFSGFCPACLCERLTTLDQSSSSIPSSSSRRPSTSSSSAAAALKSLFSSSFSKPSANVAAFSTSNPSVTKPSQPTSFLPELRRSKSFSASKQEALGFNVPASFEPQRKSCDVWGRSTLLSLFTLDDEYKNVSSVMPTTSSTNVHQASTSINNPCVKEHVFKSKEEDKEVEVHDGDNKVLENGDEIIPVVEEAYSQERGDFSLEIVEEEEGVQLSPEKPMKDHFDLDSKAKKPPAGGKDLKEIAGNFWSAASVFSKRWHKWRQKQKLKKHNNGKNSATLPVEKPISRQYRETQSEVADYGFGRRSCDIDPRFSLDAGRISFEDPRYSFDEPRASWDGYLIGRKSFSRRNPMVSVVEDDSAVHITRSDHQIPVEETPSFVNRVEEDEVLPGGSAQTMEYYTDSSSRRRKSVDRTGSFRKSNADVVDIDEMKAASNVNVLLDEVDYLQGTNLLTGNREAMSNSLRKDCLESIEMPSFRDNDSIIGHMPRKGAKKSRRWSWNIWGFIHRRSSGSTNLDGDRFCSSSRMERSFSASWHDRRWEGSGKARGMINGKAFRSNSSVSWRHSTNTGLLHRNNSLNGRRKKQRDEFILDRNRSSRYLPNHGSNGMLSHQLTPLGSSHRGGGIAKTQPNGSHSIATSVLGLY